jgi:hypothetical protein
MELAQRQLPSELRIAPYNYGAARFCSPASPSQEAHGCFNFLVRTSTSGLGKAIGTLGHAQSSATLTPIGRALTPSWKVLSRFPGFNPPSSNN